MHLAVGIAAGCQDDAHHGDLLQVFLGVTLPARRVNRHRLDDVLTTQRQLISRRVGIVVAMGAGQGPGPSTTGMRNASPGSSISAVNLLQVLYAGWKQNPRQLADPSKHEGDRQSG